MSISSSLQLFAFSWYVVDMADALQSTAADDHGESTNINKSKKEIQENERLKMQ